MRRIYPLTLAALVLGAVGLWAQSTVSVNPLVSSTRQVGATSRSCGVLATSTTAVSTTAVTTEEDLYIYTMPAGFLAADGQGIRLTAWGVTAANANTKSIRLRAGPALIIAAFRGGAFNNYAWRLDLNLIRTGVAGQLLNSLSSASVNDGSSASSGVFSLIGAQAMTNAYALKVTGQNGTAAAGDITFQGAVVECL